MKTYFTIVLFLAVSLLAAARDPSHEYDSTLARQLGADDERIVRSVEFWYDANTIRGRKALVRLFGRG